MSRKQYQCMCMAAILAAQCMMYSGCKSAPARENDIVEQTVTPTPTTVPIETEAEDGILHGNVKIANSKSGYSGSGYVTGIEQDSDSIEFPVTVEEEGFYDLTFICSTGSGKKENFVLVDNESVGSIKTESTDFTESSLSRVFLSKGDHSIQIKKSWGWIDVDKLILTACEPVDPAIYQVPATLVNANASENAKRLMSYMTDIYGKQFLSGQYCDTGMYGSEFATLWKVNGNKYPAVLGLDLTSATPMSVKHGSVYHGNEYAKEFWDQGGIVTFCWHWTSPDKYVKGNWYSSFYTDSTNIDIDKIMNGQDQEGYDLLMKDIDAIAVQLKELCDAGVPILFRPLHEASGAWFWWGAKGPDAYKKLYIKLYDRLTNEYGLNNLIWVWNGQNKDWYPGDEYVDIIGEDLYPGEHVYTSQAAKFFEAVDYTTAKKMVIESENGCLFDPDLAIRDGAMWGMFGTWGGEFVTTSKTIHWYSEQYTEESMVQKVYNHEAVITLDELPDLKTYPIHE